MEEVDTIILHFLRRLDIKISDDVKNIGELSTEIIIESASKCLRTIDHTSEIPLSLPPGISHRIEVAAQIATMTKDLGYKNDVGYQTFLYSNETELRQVFMFLIEKLPSENKQILTTQSTSEKAAFLQNISRKIEEELNSIWIPSCCMNSSTTKTIGDFTDTNKASFNTVDCDEKDIIKMLIMLKEKSLHNEQKVTSYSNKQIHIEKKKIETDKSLKDLKEMAILLKQKIESLETEKNIMSMEYSQARKSCEKVEADLKNMQNILHDIGVTNIVDLEPCNILENVQKNISLLHQKSEEITSNNLSLKVKIEKIRNTTLYSESDRMKYKKKLMDLKDNAKLMRVEYDKKNGLRNELEENYKMLKGGSKRYIYTKRILEIISNVDKQNIEIKKILEDTKSLQKEINTLEAQLDRCFSIADETLFKDAKKDDQAKKAYKLLALLHSECNSIVSLINDTGLLARDIVDLEDNIETEKAKKTEEVLKKIKVDLNRIQEECI